MNLKKYIKKLIILLCVFFVFSIVFVMQLHLVFPSRLLLFEGEEYIYDVNRPFNVDIQVNKSGVLSLNGNVIEDNYIVNLKNPVVIKSEKLGNYIMDLKLFGLIPFKSVKVDIVPKVYVIPCGNTVGVKLYTDGILVVGSSGVKGINGKNYFPWKDAKIKPGDIIESLGNIQLNSVEHLMEIIEMSQGNELNVTINRRGEIINTKITPAKSIEDKKFKLGLWVRDSTAGIGTLTFYEPSTNCFGALGHGITDIDTGQLLTVKEGSILKSKVISVRKGEKGNPGELKGIFIQDEYDLGNIACNTECGIFGTLARPMDSDIQPMPIASRNQVKEGKAYILSNVEGYKIKKYEIEIQKVMIQNERKSKGMVIKITDKDLLKKTGGIVQGMSGSPIIQDNRIVGAVTHVFVNDPTRGYGIFIQWMIDGINY